MNKTKIKILPEDKIKLTQKQMNLIELAFDKQVPPEDAKFIEKVQAEVKNGEDHSSSLARNIKLFLMSGMIKMHLG